MNYHISSVSFPIHPKNSSQTGTQAHHRFPAVLIRIPNKPTPFQMGFNHFKQNDKEEVKGLGVLIPEVHTNCVGSLYDDTIIRTLKCSLSPFVSLSPSPLSVYYHSYGNVIIAQYLFINISHRVLLQCCLSISSHPPPPPYHSCDTIA